MPKYVISEQASADLIDIVNYTDERFGTYQADAYHAGLEHIFELLARFPRIGRSAHELAPNYRRYRYQAHYVFYTEEADHILIRAIIHAGQDLRPELFD